MKNLAGKLPSVDRLLRSDLGQALVAQFGRVPVASALAEQLKKAREQLLKNEESVPTDSALLNEATQELERSNRPLKTVINLTGTVLHTNLGRARLPESAINAIRNVAESPSNIEFDLSTGKRGDRDALLERLLKDLTGAEAATVVNNNAAAVMLTLNTFALGKTVPVSRGELVEIGGSFRIPEIMERSGCELVEVGATNRTRLADFKAAMTKSTAMLMKVHTSNYQVQGFTESTPEPELADLATQHDLPFMIDLGSGTLIDLTQYGIPREPTVQDALAQGATLVTFSGDKLLGGPQAGIIVGKASYINAIKQNPMKRAMRVDKMTLAGLTEVLKLYQTPETLCDTLPTIRDLARPEQAIKALGAQILQQLESVPTRGFKIELMPVKSQIGSGALPVERIPSWAIAVSSRDTPSSRAIMTLAAEFRQQPRPVIGRIYQDHLLFDLRTLHDPQPLVEAFAAVLSP